MSDVKHHERTLRGDIEGLRAIAVGLVLLFHLKVPGLSAGFAGVDVFFVISGFLITSQMLKEVDRTGTVSITRFYARRARRLLPAATVVLVFTAVVGLFVLPGGQLAAMGRDVIASALYVVNWALAWRSVDYLAEDNIASPVQHYWSLSVEEQFYVVWPLLVIVGAYAARRAGWAPRATLFGMLLVTTLTSFVWSVVHTASNPSLAYFVTTTRIWELGIGALAAFLVLPFARLSRRMSEVLVWSGLALIVASCFLITAATPWPSYRALLPTLGSVLVILAGSGGQRTAGARLLGIRPMVWVGGLSYAIYLWHWPLLLFAEEIWTSLSPLGLALVGAASLGAAWLSKHLVEDPIRFHPVLSTRTKHALVMGAVGMLASSAAGYAVVTRAPTLEILTVTADSGALALVAPSQEGSTAPYRLRDDIAAVVTKSGRVWPAPSLADKDVPGYYGTECQVDTEGVEAREDCVLGDPAGAIRVAVAGDSKIGQWTDALDELGKSLGWRVELYVKSACSFHDGKQVLRSKDYTSCRDFVRNSLTRMATDEHRPDIVFISGSTHGQQAVDGYTRSVRALQATGAEVVLLADNPIPNRKQLAVGESVYECVDKSNDYRDCSFTANDGAGTSALRAAAKNVTGAHFISLNQWFCPDGTTCPAVIGRVLVYRQGSHVTNTYARTLVPVLARELYAAGVIDKLPAAP